MGCVQFTGVDDEAKARKSHRRYSRLGLGSALLAAKATYLEPFIFLKFISVLRGTTNHLYFSTLGNDEIESRLN